MTSSAADIRQHMAYMTWTFLIVFLALGTPLYSQDDDRWTETINQARETYGQGDPETAINTLTTLVELGGQLGTIDADSLSRMHYLLAKIYFETGDSQKCNEHLGHLFALSPNFETDEANEDFAGRVAEVSASARRAHQTLDLEILEATKTVDAMTVAANIAIHSEKGIICKPAAMPPKDGYIFLKIGAVLHNETANEIPFRLTNLTIVNASGEPVFLLHLATFDDGTECYTDRNINLPTIEAGTQAEIRLLAIAEENSPGLTLKYRDVSAATWDVQSLPMTAEEVKPPPETSDTVIYLGTATIGKPISVSHKGKKLNVKMQRIIPGATNVILASIAYEELPKDLQIQAQQKGYQRGDSVMLSIGEAKDSIEVLPAEERER